MFVDSSTTRLNGKAYPRHLLRESYREAGKVKHRTIANLSHCKAEEVEAIRLALRHKADLAGMVAAAAERALELVQGPSVGRFGCCRNWPATSASSPPWARIGRGSRGWGQASRAVWARARGPRGGGGGGG